jgi:hypothetical protein
MKKPLPLLLATLAALVPLVGASPVAAGPVSAAAVAPVVAQPAVLADGAPALAVVSFAGTRSPASARSRESSLDRRTIFEILCGGSEPSDPDLTEHLWRVAESLAERGWTPPTVTVRTVVRSQRD